MKNKALHSLITIFLFISANKALAWDSHKLPTETAIPRSPQSLAPKVRAPSSGFNVMSTTSLTPLSSRRLISQSSGSLTMKTHKKSRPDKISFEFELISDHDVKSVLKKFPESDSKPSVAIGDQILKYLMQTNRYEKVYLLRDTNKLIIRGKPSKVIGKISIQGNKLIDDKQAISLGGLSIGKKLDRASANAGAERLKKYYGERGYLNTKVHIYFKKLARHLIHVNYEIKEKAPCLIEKIVLNTSNKELEKDGLSNLKKYYNRKFSNNTRDQIDETVRKIFQENRYISAQLNEDRVIYNKEKTKVTLIYEIKDPYKYEIYVSGNKFYTLSSILRTFKIKEYQGDSVDPINNMRLRLRERYKNKGFAQIKINYDIKVDKISSTKKVMFNIDEGPQVKIHKIEVIGQLSDKSKTYEQFIRYNSSKLIASGYFKSEDIKNGRDNLITHLRNQGYFKARHLSTTFKYKDRDKSLIVASITINEGPLTRVGKVHFTNAKSFPHKELINQVQLKNKSPLHLNKLESSLKSLIDFYKQNGFLEARVVNKNPGDIKDPRKQLVQFKGFSTTANLNFIIYEGPKIKVASISIDGHQSTKDYVVLREIDFDVGDTLTYEKIVTSQQNLNRLGIFSQVDIYTLEEGSSISHRTVVIRVREANPGTFKAGVGLTNERQLTGRLYIGTNYNNIMGTARSISGRLDYKANLIKKRESNEARFTASYLEPYLFHSMWRGRISSIIERELRDEDSQAERYVSSKRLDLLLERELTKDIKLTWTLWSQTQRQLDVEPKSGSDLQRETLSQLNIAQIGPSLNFEYRDNPFLPTKGSYGKLSALYASPQFGSSPSVHFLRLEGNYRYYLPIGQTQWIWANSYSTGYIKDYLENNGESGIPFSSFFFLGGQNSIRGFGGSSELERIPNSDALNLSDPNSQTQLRQAELIRTEEVFYTLIRSELRFPIRGALGGVIFYDAGEVNMSDIPQTKSWRQSFGFGLRLNSPFGPVILDYARKVKPLTGLGPSGRQREREDRVHIAIGTF